MGITLQEYQSRRETLMKKLGPDAVAVLAAAPHHKRTLSSEYPYRQDSNFYYLTGFNEPQAVLVLLPKTSEVILFNQEQNAQKMQWEGPLLGQEAACETLGVSQSYAISDIDERLPKLIDGKKVYSTHVQLPGINVKTEALEPILAEQRVIKSPAEVELMRRAAQISVAGHKRGMQHVKHCDYEYQLAAEYEYIFKREGGNSPAYDSIVGGGGNACVLHYRTNSEKLFPKDLVLVDSATEYENYAADITRTYPVSGRFSPQQKDIYEVVLRAQENAIKQVKPGNTWEAIQKQVVNDLVEGLLEVKAITGDKNEIIAKQTYRDFYMHSVGHWLGLDVHDVGTYKINEKPRPFETGMTLTIEPGVYITDLQIGIRIEDDIVVTPDGCDVLSSGLPKTVSDIENEMAK